jgi:hypothetical protein
MAQQFHYIEEIVLGAAEAIIIFVAKKNAHK